MKEEALLQKTSKRFTDSGGYDVTIIGAGPAGMSAALCAARAKLKVLLIDKALPGGETSTAYKIDNLIGFPGGILGTELAYRMEEHIRDYDIDFVCENVSEIKHIKDATKIICTDLGNVYKTTTLILALGLEPKKLDSGLESRFLGRGVSYYAQGDADFYTGQDVMVIGGGNCACYAADHLSKYVNNLYLVHKSNFIKAVKSVSDEVLSNPKIKTFWNSRVKEVLGVDRVEKVQIYNELTGQTIWLDVKCIFVYEGRIPPQDLLSIDLKVDEKGYIFTDEYMRTNLPGVFAAGDVRVKQIRQIATSISDGMIAAINAVREVQK